MKHTIFFLSCILLLSLPLSLFAEQPNILFIFTDDQTFSTISALGHPIVQTPNLDTLAAEGTTFTNTYIQGAWHGAVCVASRSMLNTGRFLWNAQRKTDAFSKTVGEERRQAEEEFWSRRMKSLGYTTYFTGKWHVDGVDVEPLFDRVGLVRAGMPPTVNSSYNRPQEDAEDVWSPFDPQFQGHWSGGQHWAEALAESVEGFLSEAGEKDEPFFMYVAFNSPHDPRQSPKQYVDMYPADEMDVPANFLPENPHKDIMGCPATLRDEMLAPYPRTEHAVRVHRREYYGIISHMDAQIGRILAALEKTGKRENTYIFFTADNGLAIGSHGLFGKQSMYEHSVRVPMIVVGPDFPKEKRIAEPVYLQDIMPTTLEIAGGEVPAYVQFKSLLPLLADENSPHYDAIYGGYMGLQRMIRKDGYKLIFYPNPSGEPIFLLFDLKSDPDEIENLAEKPEFAEKVSELYVEFLRIRGETGDVLEIKP